MAVVVSPRPPEIQGAWFPSGYHGHFRSKSRNDFLNEFRHLAKPTPPQKYIRRAQAPVSKHVFSKHDNKQAFLDNALYFSEGHGRKRISSKCVSKYKPDFMAWMPDKYVLDTGGPSLSSYKMTYHCGTHPAKQMMIKRPKTSFDPEQRPTTSYRYSHCSDNPNQQTLNAMNNTFLTSRRVRPHTSKTRESVASCLSWNTGKPSFRPQVPATPLTPPPYMASATEPVVASLE